MVRPNDADYETLKWLLERLNTSEDYCEPYFERAKRHYKLYRFDSAVDKDDWPYVNRVRSRDILAFIEDSTAILIQTLFAQIPFFAVIPRETRLMMQQHTGIDPMLLGDQISRALDYQISHEDTEFFEEIVDFFKGGCIFGNSYMGVYPKFTPEGVYLRPMLKTTDYWDVLPVVGAKRASRARGVFVREFQALESLQEDAARGMYKNVELLRGRGSVGSDPQYAWHKQLLQEVGMTNYIASDGDDIEVIHYFSGGHIITFADRRVLLRNSNEPMSNQMTGQSQVIKPFPYDMPIVQYKYMPIPLEFFGMGIPEVLEILQEDKNLIDSARRDNIDLVIQKVLKARSGADLNFDLMKFYPGAIWPMENLADVEEMEMQDVTQSSYQESAKKTAEMENALSLFGYARGMTPTHTEQPTTVLKLQQASLNRLDLAVKLAEFTTLQNIATRIILLTRRFMPPDVYESIIGDVDAGFYRLSEEDIRRFYYFKPVGSSVTNIKELRQQQIQTAIQLTMGIPPQMTAMNIEPFTVNLYELLKTAYDAVDIKNADRILIKLNPEENMMNPANPTSPMGQMMLGGGMPGVGQGATEIESPQSPQMKELANVLYGGGRQ